MLIHIIQKNDEVVESYIIDCSEIVEMHCQYPIVQHEDPAQVETLHADTVCEELNILYKNGERFTLSITAPTIFALRTDEETEDGTSIIRTRSLRDMEKAYVDAASTAYEAINDE